MSNKASRTMMLGEKIKPKLAKKLDIVQDLYKNEEEMMTLIHQFAKDHAVIGSSKSSRGNFKASKIALVRELYDVLEMHEQYNGTSDFDRANLKIEWDQL